MANFVNWNSNLFNRKMRTEELSKRTSVNIQEKA